MIMRRIIPCDAFTKIETFETNSTYYQYDTVDRLISTIFPNDTMDNLSNNPHT